jgi:flagellar basal body P-ring formation protein FlgA
MTRVRLLAFALAGLVGAVLFGRVAAAEEAAAAPLVLRSAVTVDSTVIRLGDLFEGSLESSYIPVAKAPAPGQSITLDARWLGAAARAFKLEWKPSSRFEQSVVTRASKRISAEAVKNAIVAAIADAGSIEDISSVDFQFEATAMELEIGTDVEATLGVQDLVVDDRSGRFTATVVVPATGAAVASTQVSGQRIELTDVPVLAVRRMPGEVILASDVKWAQVRTDRIASNTVLDPAQIIGMTPRRPLKMGEQLRASDLDRALTIRKGSLVTITLQSAQMTLTVLGRALEDGAQGQPIQVVNTKSNRVVQGVVQDAGTVVVLALQ